MPSMFDTLGLQIQSDGSPIATSPDIINFVTGTVTESPVKTINFTAPTVSAITQLLRIIPMENSESVGFGAPGDGASADVNNKVFTCPFYLPQPMTIKNIAVNVTAIKNGGVIDFAIFSADGQTRYLHTGWQAALGVGLNRYAVSPNVVLLNPATYIYAFSIQTTGTTAATTTNFSRTTQGGTSAQMRNLINGSSTIRLGTNSVNSDGTTGIPATLTFPITQTTSSDLPLVALLGE